jgi:nicotinamide-nucleotide amidase
VKAEIIAVGSELLRLGREETNGDWLVARLEEVGIEVAQRSRVEDDRPRLVSIVAGALERSQIVAVTGGLGPTDDDRTREALATALGQPLERDPDRLLALERRLRAYGVKMSEGQARQADRPRGALWIDNPLGSACGLLVLRGERLLFALPGVPAEMKAMFRASVLPRLAGRGRSGLARRSIRVVGRGESSVDEEIRDLYDAPGIDVTILGGEGGVELQLRAVGTDRADAERLLDRLERIVLERLGVDVLGTGEETLAAVVGRLLARQRKTLATAESCTAGLLGAEITAVAGSSEWYRGGAIVYSDDLKVSLVGVRPETIAAHGAVSEAVARELARGASERFRADVGIGITGIAGPDGGTPAKPVGRVHLAVCDGGESLHWRRDFVGNREAVRRRAVATALDRLRRRLTEVS